jgi:hypothetical protein
MNFFGDDFAVHPGISSRTSLALCLVAMAVFPPTMYLWMRLRRWL